jgi:aryl-alcohol dehydrogenase-like predicted oxidoreductase
MEYVDLKGLHLSRLTLGTVQLGMDYGIANTAGKPDYERSSGILDAALEGGINAFDTAAAYGDSEAVIGRYFGSLPEGAAEPIIITKLKTGTDVPLKRKELYDLVRGSVKDSLKRLGRDKVEVLMLHSAQDIDVHGETIVRAMEDIRDEGLTERIGVSVYTPEATEEVLGYKAFDAVQIPVNIMDTRLLKTGILEKLSEAGIIVFARSVFLQGLFFREPESLPEKLKAAIPYLEILSQSAKEEEMTIAQLAFGYVRDLPGVTSFVVGAEEAEQVRENIRLFKAPKISEETTKKLRKEFEDVPEQVLNPGLWK